MSTDVLAAPYLPASLGPSAPVRRLKYISPDTCLIMPAFESIDSRKSDACIIALLSVCGLSIERPMLPLSMAKQGLPFALANGLLPPRVFQRPPLISKAPEYSPLLHSEITYQHPLHHKNTHRHPAGRWRSVLYRPVKAGCSNNKKTKGECGRQ